LTLLTAVKRRSIGAAKAHMQKSAVTKRVASESCILSGWVEKYRIKDGQLREKEWKKVNGEH